MLIYVHNDHIGFSLVKMLCRTITEEETFIMKIIPNVLKHLEVAYIHFTTLGG